MKYEVYSNRGKLRERNEDNYLVKLDPVTLLAVADGMGGHKAGEVASKITVQFLEDYHFLPSYNFLEQIDRVIRQINQKILSAGLQNPDYNGMGTTLSLGLIEKQNLYIGHIGDSRIYLFREKSLTQLTRDHSLVNRLIDQQRISLEEAFDHPQRHILTQALGTGDTLQPAVDQYSLQSGDKLLFCTDGLSDMVRPVEIEGLFRQEQDISKLSNLLGQRAMANGGSDNITLIICQL